MTTVTWHLVHIFSQSLLIFQKKKKVETATTSGEDVRGRFWCWIWIEDKEKHSSHILENWCKNEAILCLAAVFFWILRKIKKIIKCTNSAENALLLPAMHELLWFYLSRNAEATDCFMLLLLLVSNYMKMNGPPYWILIIWGSWRTLFILFFPLTHSVLPVSSCILSPKYCSLSIWDVAAPNRRLDLKHQKTPNTPSTPP